MKKIFLLFLLVSTILFSQTNYNTLGGWDANGVPDYLVEDKEVSDDLLNLIRVALPSAKSVPERHPEYIATGTQLNVVLTQQTDVYVTFVTEGAGYKNVLGFYTYQLGNKPQSVEDIQESMTIIFPNSSRLNSGGGLQPGNTVDIGNFPANTVIGWFLLADGYRSPNVNNGHWQLFSDRNLNPESDSLLRAHNVFLKDAFSDKVILGFEDIRRDYGSCDNDFEDVLFYVTTEVPDAIDDEDIVVVEDPESKNKVNLSITKDASNTNPVDGEDLSFTLTLSNAGPDTATAVTVSEVLPAGLNYVSHSTTNGNYDVLTGVWSIDELLPDASTVLTINTKVNLQDISQAAFDLGVAKEFNMFVLNDLTQPSADTEGKVAVGGNAYLANYSVGEKLPIVGMQENALVVNKNLTFLSGSVINGDVVYGVGTNLPTDMVSIENGTLIQDTPIDFNEARGYLQSLSQSLRGYVVNGQTTFENSGLVLTGTDPFLNVFEVEETDFNVATSMTISAPNGSVVLVNTSGESLTWSGGLEVLGTATNNVLFNFANTKNLRIESIDVTGSILAPFANIEFPSGVVNGQVIAKSIYGSGQFNSGDHYATHFVGNVPVTEKLLNSTEILSYDQYDYDLSDNQDEVEITLAGFGDPDNTGQIEWSEVTAITSGDMIWKMTEDKDNFLLAGTWGGKILRTTDNDTEWTQLNIGMNVAYIWDLFVDGDIIFAATERGVYKSEDNGANWAATGLTTCDVRSVLVYNNKVYAGTWGDGLYVSNDNGANWSKPSKDIGTTSVHALAVNSNGVLFAGTYGNGVYKSEDNGANWVALAVGYDFIWSLVVDTQDNIIAGTYGAGVFYSATNGDSWSALGANVPATHIYSLRVDSNGNVFASAWNGGVFLLETQEKSGSWVSLGLAGLNVSSIWFDESAGTLYAGTADGRVYTTTDYLTDLEDNLTSVVPEQFGLNQNYPNPFNPSTNISFTISEAGKYSLEVYNILGQKVATVFEGNLNAGKYTKTFSGKELSSGMYIYQLAGQNFKSVKKMILIK